MYLKIQGTIFLHNKETAMKCQRLNNVTCTSFLFQAITIAWISVGYMFQTMGIGRSDEGRSNPEPWEELVPDSGTVGTE